MNRITVFEHERMSVWCYPPRGLIHHEMHKPTAGDTFRNALRAGLTAMRECKATRWLSDDHLHIALAPEDEVWAQNVWFPQSKAAGWKHWAVIRPQSAVGELSSSRFRNPEVVRVTRNQRPALHRRGRSAPLARRTAVITKPASPGQEEGWWIATEVDVVYSEHRCFRHDVSGWRKSRVPERPVGNRVQRCDKNRRPAPRQSTRNR
jgi:hypothetical protein